MLLLAIAVHALAAITGTYDLAKCGISIAIDQKISPGNFFGQTACTLVDEFIHLPLNFSKEDTLFHY